MRLKNWRLDLCRGVIDIPSSISVYLSYNCSVPVHKLLGNVEERYRAITPTSTLSLNVSKETNNEDFYKFQFS